MGQNRKILRLSYIKLLLSTNIKSFAENAYDCRPCKIAIKQRIWNSYKTFYTSFAILLTSSLWRKQNYKEHQGIIITAMSW